LAGLTGEYLSVEGMKGLWKEETAKELRRVLLTAQINACIKRAVIAKLAPWI
jgi:hypothetical protein